MEDFNNPGEFNVGESSVTDSGIKLSSSLYSSSKEYLLTLKYADVSPTQAKMPDKSSVVISKVATADPLILSVNPQSLVISMSKSLSDTSYTRAGFIPQFWGEELDTIQIEGTTAAFIHSKEGLTRQKAQNTEGFSNFLKLVHMYKNNGANYIDPKLLTKPASVGKTLGAIKTSFTDLKKDPMALVSTKRKIIKTRRLIELDYLTLKCFGLFDNFSYSESADKPFHINYSFTFSVLFYNTDNKVHVEGHLGKN